MAWEKHTDMSAVVEQQQNHRYRVHVCVCMCVCVQCTESTNREREGKMQNETMGEQLAQQISRRSKSRCLALSLKQDYLKSEIYEPRSSMGLL